MPVANLRKGLPLTTRCILPAGLLVLPFTAWRGFWRVAVNVAWEMGVFELDGGMSDAELAG